MYWWPRRTSSIRAIDRSTWFVLSFAVKERQHGSRTLGALHENCIASTSIFILKIETRDPSYEGPTADALAPTTDEGRERLR